MTEISLILAGLAFFFGGLASVKTGFRQLATPRIRNVLQRLVRNPLFAAFWGAVSGALTQSATVVSFILTGLVAVGAISVASALVVVSFANLGTVLLVWVASLDTRILAFLLIGIGGLLGGLTIFRRVQPAFVVLSGIGSIFLGLVFLRDAGGRLPEATWFPMVSELLTGSALGAFLFGLLLRVVVQSTSGIVLIAATLAGAGLFSDPQVLLVMHATAIGAGVSGLLLGRGIGGMPRRIVIFQALINVSAGLVLALLWVVDRKADLPLLAAGLVSDGAAGSTRWVPIAFLVQQGLVTGVGLALAPIAPRWLERWSPSTVEESLARPQFVSIQAVDDPIVMVDLARCEQHRLVVHLPSLLDGLAADSDGDLAGGRGAATGLRTLAAEIDAFLGLRLRHGVEGDAGEALLDLQADQRRIEDLLDSLDGFVSRAAQIEEHDGLAAVPVTRSMVEGLHFLLTLLASEDEAERQVIPVVTDDRGGLTERIREELAGECANPHAAEVLELAAFFDRAVWSIRRLAGASASPDQDAGGVSSSTSDPDDREPDPDDDGARLAGMTIDV